MAPEVAEHLGEEADRYQTEAAIGIGSCRDCSRPVAAATEPSSLVLLISPPQAAPGRFMTIAVTHAACSPSEVRQMPRVEIENYLLGTPETIGSVTAMGAVLRSPAGPHRPVLFVSNHGELTIFTETGDRVDAMASELFGAGWEMVTQLDNNPVARGDARVRFTPSRLEGEFVAGRLFISTGPKVMADLELLAHPLWLELVVDQGEVPVYAGRLSVQHWTAGVDYTRISRALSAGSLAGCTLPAELIST